VGFGATIEEVWCGRSQSFFPVEGGFETFFDEAFAEVGDGMGVSVTLLGDGFASGNEFLKFVAFFGGQGDFVYFSHFNLLVW
jgi:hypothetical protein